MSRLQKKCFIGATGMHLLLMVILFVGPAFFVAEKKIDESDVITFEPVDLTDKPFSNPGATAPRPAPQAQPQPQLPAQPQQLVEPPKPQPPPKTERDPDPPKTEVTRNNKPDPDSLETKTEKKKPQVKVSNTVVKLKPSKNTSTSKETQQTDANKERQQQIASTLKNIRGNLSATTRIEVPEGPGAGTGSGAPYANYAQEVRRVYTAACQIPPDVEDESAVVKVRVTIARSGNVISSSIVSPSSSAQLNRVIQATLDRVNFVAPFPQGAKDSQRTFIISFDLKAKNLLG